LLKHNCSQRREGQQEGVASIVARLAQRLETPQVAEPLSPVFPGIAVKHLSPEAALGNSHAIVHTRYWRKVENHEHWFTTRPSLSEIADDARFLVAEINPLEARIVEVEL